LRAAERRQPPRCLAGDQRFQSGAHEGGLFTNARRFPSAFEEVLVND
jgi:hypothetical protein